MGQPNKTIGMTSSGKPVYDTFNPNRVKDYTSQDHFEAGVLFQSIINAILTNYSSDKDWQKKALFYMDQNDAHTRLGFQCLYFEKPIPGSGYGEDSGAA